jgi:eukaryotic-like serine/threonine-protein kinase
MSRVVGVITDAPVILIDDLLNSGATFMTQVNLIKDLHASGDTKAVVTDVFTILRFKEMTSYSDFTEAKIKISAVFSLDDFSRTLGVQNVNESSQVSRPVSYPVVWRYQGGEARLTPVLPKSDVLFAYGRVYFGTDTGHFICLESKSGKLLWQYHVPLGSRKREAFSSPVICGHVIAVGSRDGNVYAFDRLSGKRLWVSLEADWLQGGLGASEELGYFFLPLSFGLFKKQGKVVAVDSKTGKHLWEFSIAAPLGGGICYLAKTKLVYLGTEDGTFFALDARKGTVVWQKKLLIKARGNPVLCKETETVFVSGVPVEDSVDDKGCVYGLEQKSGRQSLIFSDFLFGSYGTMLIHDGKMFFTALDKYLYCVDISTNSCLWSFDLGARAFTSPVLLLLPSGQVVVSVGANNGRLYVLDAASAKIISVTYLSERILNNVAVDYEQGLIFVPTQANEVYALRFLQNGSTGTF